MIKFNSIAAAAVCLALFAPATSPAQIKKAGNGYLMRLKFKAGEVHKYSLLTTVTGLPASAATGGGSGIRVTGSMEQKVVSVKGKVATILVSTSAMTMSSGQAVGEPKSMTVTVDDQGNSSGGNAQGSFGVHLPKGPVKVGETWNMKTEVPGGTMGASAGGSVTATYKFNGIKHVGRQSLADVTFSLSSTGMLKGGTGHALLLPENGALSSMTMKMMVSNPMGGADLTTVVSIQTVK
jgi:hypothetical protein